MSGGALVMAIAFALCAVPAGADELPPQIKEAVRQEFERLWLAKDTPPASGVSDAELAAIRSEVERLYKTKAGSAQKEMKPAQKPEDQSIPSVCPNAEDTPVDGCSVPPPGLGGSAGIATLDRPLNGSESAVQIQAEAGKTDASIIFSQAPVPESTRGGGTSYSQWSATVTAPLNDDSSGRATFATLDRLSGSLGVKLSWTKSWVGHVAGQRNAGVPDSARKKLCESIGVEVSSPECSLAKLATKASSGETPGLRTAFEQYMDDNYEPAYTLGFHGAGARSKHSFYDEVLTKVEDTKLAWSTGVAFGRTSADRNWLIAVGFDLQHSYKDVKEQILCPPSTAPTLACLRGSFQPAKSLMSRTFWVENRYIVGKVPFSVKISRDFANDESGVDIPLYFIRGKDGQFTGGVRFGWTSTDQFQAGVFVGASLDTLIH